MQSVSTNPKSRERQPVNISDFDSLPDAAFVPVQMLAKITHQSVPTAWRRTKELDYPKPVKLSARCTRFKVGDIRRWMASREAVAT